MTGCEQKAIRARAAAVTGERIREAIRRHLQELGLSQSDFCLLSGVTTSSLSRLLSQERRVTPLDRVLAALGMLDLQSACGSPEYARLIDAAMRLVEWADTEWVGSSDPEDIRIIESLRAAIVALPVREVPRG